MDLAFNPYIAFAWSLVAGFLMAMGAGGGGILAGIGHISILGVGDPNMIKVVNQLLEFTSRVFAVPLYLRQQRVIWSLAVSFGVGAPLGAVAGSWLSRTYLADMGTYRIAFGVLVLLVAGRTLYEAMAKPAQRGKRLQKAFDASNAARHDVATGGGVRPIPPRIVRFHLLRTEVKCGNDTFTFNPAAAAAGGFGVSFVGSMLGVGGGFLVTPLMASVLAFPMFFVAGTALAALMVPLVVSVLTYLLLSVQVDWILVAVEVPGIAIGSLLAPMINQRVNERSLRLFVACVLAGIGVYYLTLPG